MKFIDRKTHGYLDYIVGLLLIAAPWLLDFYRGGAETWVPVILGVGVILYSLFTDYELGAARKIPFGTHLTLDILGGIFLAVSPWLFNFDEHVYLPHLVAGIMEIAVASFTKRTNTAHSGHEHGERRFATH
jgi:hypothetical protein